MATATDDFEVITPPDSDFEIIPPAEETIASRNTIIGAPPEQDDSPAGTLQARDNIVHVKGEDGVWHALEAAPGYKLERAEWGRLPEINKVPVRAVRDLDSVQARAVHGPDDPDLDKKLHLNYRRVWGANADTILASHLSSGYIVPDDSPASKMKLANRALQYELTGKNDALLKDVGGGYFMDPKTPEGLETVAQQAQADPPGVVGSFMAGAAQTETAILSPILPGSQTVREIVARVAAENNPKATGLGQALGTLGEPTTALTALAAGGMTKAALPALAAKFEAAGLSKAAAASLAQKTLAVAGTTAMSAQMTEASTLGGEGRFATAGELGKSQAAFMAMPIAGKLTGDFVQRFPGVANTFARVEKASPVLANVSAGLAKSVAGMVETNTAMRTAEGKPTTAEELFNDTAMALAAHVAMGGTAGDVSKGQEINAAKARQEQFAQFIKDRDSIIKAAISRSGLKATDDLTAAMMNKPEEKAPSTTPPETTETPLGAVGGKNPPETPAVEANAQPVQTPPAGQALEVASKTEVPAKGETNAVRVEGPNESSVRNGGIRGSNQPGGVGEGNAPSGEPTRAGEQGAGAGGKPEGTAPVKPEEPAKLDEGVKTVHDLRKLTFEDLDPASETKGVAANAGKRYRYGSFTATDENGSEHRYTVGINNEGTQKIEDLGRTGNQIAKDQIRDYNALGENTRAAIDALNLPLKNNTQKTIIGETMEGKDVWLSLKAVLGAGDIAEAFKKAFPGVNTVGEAQKALREHLKNFKPTPTENARGEAKLTYEEFVRQYREAWKNVNKYTSDQVGQKVFVDKMADLADKYPDHLARFEAEPPEKQEEPTTPPAVPAGGKVTPTSVRRPADVQDPALVRHIKDVYEALSKGAFLKKSTVDEFLEMGGKLPTSGLHPDLAKAYGVEVPPVDATLSDLAKKTAFDLLDEKAKATFERLFATNNPTEINGLLWPMNKAYRAEWERRTGQKLPKGVKATQKFVHEFYSQKAGSTAILPTEATNAVGPERGSKEAVPQPPVVPEPPVPSGGAAPSSTPESPGEGRPGRAPDRHGAPSGAGAGETGTGSGDAGRSGGGTRTEASGGGSGRNEPTEQPGQRPHEQPAPRVEEKERPIEDRNYRAPVGEDLAPAGQIGKIRANIDAIKLLKKLEAENRNPTPEEKAVLAKYTGWGHSPQVFDKSKAQDFDQTKANGWEGESWAQETVNWGKKYHEHYKALKNLLDENEWNFARESTPFAHFTSAEVIREGLWGVAKRLGFKRGNVLENSAGIGHVVGLMPEEIIKGVHVTAVELDPMTNRMLAKMYPEATVHKMGFEEAPIRANSQALTIGNFPFNQKGQRAMKEKYPFSLHNQFFARSLDVTEPGGLIVALTSTSTMDNAASASFRRWMNERADLVGAIRLPQDTFKKNAGTDVDTDLLIFRKRDVGASPVHNDWLYTKPMDVGSGKSTDVNEYYHEHPEMMLGKMTLGGTRYAKEMPVLEAHPDKDLVSQLREAIARLPENIAKDSRPVAPERPSIGTAPEGSVESAYTLKDGKIYQVVGGELKRPEWASELGGKKEAQAASMIELRDKARAFFDKQLTPGTKDEDLVGDRAELNKLYDRYVTVYGKLNEKGSKFLHDDPMCPLGLEGMRWEKVKRPSGKEEMTQVFFKSDLFTRRTLFPRVQPTTADTIQDAVQVSESWRNGLDLDYIASLRGQTPEQAKDAILSAKLGFEDPDTGLIVSRSDYLSGNVKEKLRAAEERAKGDPAFQENVEQLKKVIPPDIHMSDTNKRGDLLLQFRLGSSWIDPQHISEWASELLGGDVHVSYDPTLAKWNVRLSDDAKYGPQNQETYSGGDLFAERLLKDALSMKESVVMDRYKDKTGWHEVRNPEKTAAANTMQDRLRELFEQWGRTGPRSKDLEQRFNDRVNTSVEKKYEAPTFKHYPNASDEITLESHQKSGVARGLRESFILGDPVGSGKTFIFQTLSQEAKRLGLAKKPVIAVLKNTLPQIINSMKRLYPTAKILFPTEGDFTPQNRQAMLKRIQTGDWDAVILTHENLVGIPDNPAQEIAFINDQIRELEEIYARRADESGKDINVKALAGKIRALRGKLDELQNRKQDELGITFDKLGVDMLIVDEAHQFKKLAFVTGMDNIKGLDKDGSQRAMSLFLKARHVQEKTGGKNVVLATGTPVTNTLAEVWNMMRFVRPDVLRDAGIEQFDQFASTYGNITHETERTDLGEWKSVTRFASFQNVRQLSQTFKRAARILEPSELKLRKPPLKGGEAQAVVVQPSPKVTEYMKFLLDWYREWNGLSGKEKREQSWVPIVINGLARKAALDMRLVDPALPADPASKLSQAADQIFSRWKAGAGQRLTQAVFADSQNSSGRRDAPPRGGQWVTDADGKVIDCEDANGKRIGLDLPESERFNLYRALKEELVKRGIPANEIAIINDAKNDKARDKMMNLVNAGDIRVIMGHSKSLGTGVNIQERLQALHHLDAPWNPADVEQREGRILRRGNINPEVEILRYGVANTFDAGAYQRLARKQAMINDALHGNVDSIEDPGGDAIASYQEAMAAISGDPLIREKFDLEHRINALETQQRMYEAKNIERQNTLATRQDRLPGEQQRVAEAEKAFPYFQNDPQFKSYEKLSAATAAGRGEGPDAAKLLDEHIKPRMEQFENDTKDRKQFARFSRAGGNVTIGGLDTSLQLYKDTDRYGKPTGEIYGTYSAKIPGTDYFINGNFTTGHGLMRSVQMEIGNLDAVLKGRRDTVADSQRIIKELSTHRQEFQGAKELEQARNRYIEVMNSLAPRTPAHTEPTGEPSRDFPTMKDPEVRAAWDQVRLSGKAALQELKNVFLGRPSGSYLMAGPPQKLAESVVQFGVDVVKALAKTGQHGFENFVRWVAHNADPVIRDEIMGRARKYYQAIRAHADITGAGLHTSMTPDDQLPPIGLKGYKITKDLAKLPPEPINAPTKKATHEADMALRAVRPDENLRIAMDVRAKAEKALGKVKALATLGEDVRKQVAGYAAELPPEIRADFLDRIAQARTPGDLRGALASMDRHIETFNQANAARDLMESIGGRKSIPKAKQETPILDRIEAGIREPENKFSEEPISLDKLAPHYKEGLAPLVESLRKTGAVDGAEHLADFLEAETEEGRSNAFTPKELNRLRKLEGMPLRGAGHPTADDTILLHRALQHAKFLNEKWVQDGKNWRNRELADIQDKIIKEVTANAKPMKERGKPGSMIRPSNPEKGLFRRFAGDVQRTLSTLAAIAGGGRDSALARLAYDDLVGEAGKSGESKALSIINEGKDILEAAEKANGWTQADIVRMSNQTEKITIAHLADDPVQASAYIELTPMERMKFAMQWNDLDTRRLMLEQHAPILPDGFRGNARHNIPITQETADAILESMTPEERRYVKALTDFQGGRIRTEGNKVRLREVGYEDWDQPGHDHRRRDLDQGQKNVRLDQKGFFRNWLESMGRLKEREGGDKPILIGNAREQFLADLEANARYIGLSEPVRNLIETLGNPDVRQTLEGTAGRHWINKVLDIAQEVSGTAQRPEPAFGWLRKVRGNVAQGILAFRISSPITHGLGGLLEASEFARSSPADLARFLGQLVNPANLLDPGAVRELQKDPYLNARWRHESGELESATNRSMADHVSRSMIGRGIKKLGKIGTMPLQYSDKRIASAAYKAWQASYRASHPKATEAEVKAWALAKTSDTVRRTGTVASPLDMAYHQLKLNRQPALSFMTMFSSKMSKMRNVVDEALADARRNPSAKSAAVLTTSIAAVLATAALVSSNRSLFGMVKKGLIGKEQTEEEKHEKVVKWSLEALAELADVFSFEGGTVVRGVEQALQGGDMGVLDETAVMSQLIRGVESGIQAGQQLAGEPDTKHPNRGDWGVAIKKGVEAITRIGTLFGLPLDAPREYVEGIINQLREETTKKRR